VFGPLGLKASFYRTEALSAASLPITYRRDGKLERWADQGRLIEQDPSKGVRLWYYLKVDCITLNFSAVTAHLGGVGVYSSLRDYLTVLRHLLQILGISTSSSDKNPDQRLLND
jgi:hypothetical protein